MTVLLEQYWWVLVIALLIGVAVAWAIFGEPQKRALKQPFPPMCSMKAQHPRGAIRL